MSSAESARKLLENKEVIAEINRHQWLESEKAGYDIGFEKAAEDWLVRFSTAWMQYHIPASKSATPVVNQPPTPAPEKKTRQKRTTVLKTRRASSYMDA